MRKSKNNWWLTLAAAATLGICASLNAADAENPAGVIGVLRLANGDYVSGALTDSSQEEVIRWQSPLFNKPLSFPLGRVNKVDFPGALERPRANGEYCLEMAGGDQLFGDLIEMNEDRLVLDVERFGKLTIDRKHVRRMLSWGEGAEIIYQGPGGLGGWDHSTGKAGWTDEGGQLVTSDADAFLHGDVDLPPQAGIEVEISWKNRADFVFAMGVDEDEKNIEQAFRLEVWEKDLVLMRETDDEVDVISLQTLAQGEGKLHLQIYLDQELNHIYVYTTDGRRLGDLEVAKKNDEGFFTFTSLRLMNKRGDLRLERLRVTEWNGEPPHDVAGDAARVHQNDGTIVNGRILSYDADAEQFLIKSGEKTVRIDRSEFANSIEPSQLPELSRNIHAIFPDTNRVSGALINVEKGQISLRSPGVTEVLRFPIADLQSLVSMHKSPPNPARQEREGRLVAEDVRLRGYLLNGEATEGASCLTFQPREGISGSPLVANASGRIIYRDAHVVKPTAKVTVQRQPQQVVQKRRGFWGGVIERLTTGDTPATVSLPSQRAIHLRTGDVVPGTVTKIDEAGVHFTSTMTDATFVPNDKIQAIEFVKAQSSIRFSKEKKKRLLTLPRIQKYNPPTHLIRSVKGDYLRCRIQSMDDEYVTVEVRVETKRIRRDYISRIIWLHGENLEKEGEENEEKEQEPKPEQPDQRELLQAQRSDGTLLTFVPHQVLDSTISGESDVLGKCGIKVNGVDQLIFGEEIAAAAANLAYHQWKLENAVEPKYLSASGMQNTGTDSPLVGEMAPDFTLKLLSGDRFHLQDHRGKIVILDFWATWCGPCMQAMPQLEKVSHEFVNQNVMLLAVNLEEAPERIRATLERLKLDPQVALDIDGAVAGKYSATSIPQTVIIDRNGKVARLFVGAGPQFDEQMRKAIQEVIEGKKPQADPPADEENKPAEEENIPTDDDKPAAEPADVIIDRF